MDTMFLSDDEFIHHYSITSTDPVIQRFVSLSKSCYDNDSSLYDLGMDSNGLFENTYSAGEYIAHLQSEVDFYSREVDELQTELHRLKTKTLIEFVAEVHHELKSAQHESTRAQREINKLESELEDTKKKLKVWTHLTSD